MKHPAIQAALESAEATWLLGPMTLVFFAAFVFWVLWAYAPFNRDTMDFAANLPLDEE